MKGVRVPGAVKSSFLGKRSFPRSRGRNPPMRGRGVLTIKNRTLSRTETEAVAKPLFPCVKTPGKSARSTFTGTFLPEEKANKFVNLLRFQSRLLKYIDSVVSQPGWSSTPPYSLIYLAFATMQVAETKKTGTEKNLVGKRIFACNRRDFALCYKGKFSVAQFEERS